METNKDEWKELRQAQANQIYNNELLKRPRGRSLFNIISSIIQIIIGFFVLILSLCATKNTKIFFVIVGFFWLTVGILNLTYLIFGQKNICRVTSKIEYFCNSKTS